MTTEPATAGPRPRRKHAATGGRIMVAGVAASAGLLMVGAMVAAARTEASAAPQVVQRVVVIETPAVGSHGAGAPAIEGNVTIVREVRILPSAPAESASAAPATTSSGS